MTIFFLREVGERLELRGFEQGYEAEGRPAYPPALRGSVWWYADALGATSWRRLERRIREGLAFRYGAGGAQPVFGTLNEPRGRRPLRRRGFEPVGVERAWATTAYHLTRMRNALGARQQVG